MINRKTDNEIKNFFLLDNNNDNKYTNDFKFKQYIV